jgi:hypothetical protein
MFNRHGLPASLIKSSNEILENSKSKYDLPEQLTDILVETATDYSKCSIREDRKELIDHHINQVMDIASLDRNTLIVFENAVDELARDLMNEKSNPFFDKMKKKKEENSSKEDDKKKDDKDDGDDEDKKDKEKSSKKDDDDKEDDDESSNEKDTDKKGQKKYRQFLKFKKKDNKKKPENNFGSKKDDDKKENKGIEEKLEYFLDVFLALNEEEMDAYLDILSEEEINILEEIIDQAKTINE